MNVFVLDRDPAAAALAHHDRHVGKMIVEAGQMLSTVARARGLSHPALYRSAYSAHPCTRWLASSPAGVAWVRDLCAGLGAEHVHRFGTRHKSAEVVSVVSALLLADMAVHPEPSAHDAALAMPDEFKTPGDPVASYRAYYRAAKAPGNRWTNRAPPAWLGASREEGHAP